MIATEKSQILILHVEDDLGHAEIARRNLLRSVNRSRIRHVRDGQEALDYLTRQGDYVDPESSPRPDLILLDLRMPKVDGFEVLKRVKDDPELMHIPVVILSTSDAEDDVAKAYEYHANSYLVKPIVFEKFVGLMESFGSYWSGYNRFHW